ncbi:MAG: hypothetical protein ACRDK0_09910 [Solirubrobacteraceae bacterium]
MTATASLHLRHASPADAGTLARLAALDETDRLQGPVLMAYADGRAVAAMSLADGRTAADPFERTADAVDLLRLKAGQERRSRASRRSLRLGGRSARLLTG